MQKLFRGGQHLLAAQEQTDGRPEGTKDRVHGNQTMLFLLQLAAPASRLPRVDSREPMSEVWSRGSRSRAVRIETVPMVWTIPEVLGHNQHTSKE